MARSWIALCLLALCLSASALGSVEDVSSRKMLAIIKSTSTTTCSASATATAKTAAASDCKQLVLKVFASFCKPGTPGTACEKKIVNGVVQYGSNCYAETVKYAELAADINVYATAFAKVVGDVFTKCQSTSTSTSTTFGVKTFGCATAVASAKAYAAASAKAFVEGFAEGYSNCQCLSSGNVDQSCGNLPCPEPSVGTQTTSAEVTATAFENLYIRLVEEAEVVIRAASCSTGTSTAISALKVECLAEGVVSLYYHLIVKALAKSSCFPVYFGSVSEVDAFAQLYADASLEYVASCTLKSGTLTATGAGSTVGLSLAASAKSTFTAFEDGIFSVSDYEEASGTASVPNGVYCKKCLAGVGCYSTAGACPPGFPTA